jgi:hypothetical protein
MKKTALTLLLLLGLVAPLLAEDSLLPLTVAVLDFQTSGEKLDKKGSEVALLLGTHLSTAPNVLLVERQEIEKILSEQEIGLGGAVTPESAAKVGALTGAKVLITGRLFESGNQLYLVAKIMSTETGRVYGEMTTLPNVAGMDKAATELSGKIDGVIAKHADALVAKSEDPAKRIERLKKIVSGKKIPTVMVQVTERHLSHAVIDPAVQTEIELTLQQLGFEVITEKDATKKAEVIISGEAFSELGMRRGNLVSCRSRIEIHLTQADNGKLLLSDRQTDVAVDLAENIAAKKALENGARKLIDRFISKLVVQK